MSAGVEQQESVNDRALQKIKASRKASVAPDELFSALHDGDRSALSRAITLIESSLPEHQQQAQEIIRLALPHTSGSFRIGITGVPGAGKSTFIETFGNFLISTGRKIAVLAIDPSSERSGGSIMGDKTRMETLSSNNNAFIRPSPSGGNLGGVARKTRESIVLCEAAGYDTVIIETVGVGQSETTVHSMVDFFLLLMVPGAGDELQGMKRGIMEMADMILINKADGDLMEVANRSKAEYANALHLFPPPPSGWIPKVSTCSAMENKGIADTWKTITEYWSFTRENGFFQSRRAEQSRYWMSQTLQEGLRLRFFNNPEVRQEMNKLEELIKRDQISSFEAATQLLNKYFPGENK